MTVEYKMKNSLTIILLLAHVLLFAQDGTIETDKLEVIKTFDVQLRDAELIEVKPVIPPVIKIQKAYNYQISIVPLELEYPAPTIRPLAMNAENTFVKYNHMLQLGYGTLNDPNGILRMSFMDGDRYKITGVVDYYQLNNDENIAFQQMANTEVGFNGFGRLNDNVIFNFDLDGQKSRRYFFDTSDSIRSSMYGTARDNENLYLKAGISNIDKTTLDLNWDFNAKYVLDRVKDEATGLGAGLEVLIEKRRNEYINLVLPVEADFYRTNLDSDESIFYVNFEPNIHFQKGKFQASVGADIYHDTKDLSQIWPEVELAYGIIGNYVQIIAGSRQDYQFQSLNRVVDYCPWLDISQYQSRSTLWQDYYAGIRGEFNFLSYQAEGGYRSTQNALLIKDTIVGQVRSLQHIHDDMTSVFIRGNIDFALSKSINVGGVLTQSIYEPENQEKAWGLPETELQAYLNWDLFNDRLNIHSDLIFTDRFFTEDLNEAGMIEEESLNAQLELNARASFTITKNVNVYGYAHNIFDNKFQRWNGYPNVGINFGGGLQVKF